MSKLTNEPINNEQAIEFSKKTVDLLARYHIEPLPENYQLFFTYVKGSNPALTAHIQHLLANTHKPNQELLEQLHAHYILDQENERLCNLGHELNHLTENLMNEVKEAVDYTQTQSNHLDKFAAGKDDAKTLVHELKQYLEEFKNHEQSYYEQLSIAKAKTEALEEDLKQKTQESLTDHLTRLYNRRAFDHNLRSLVYAEKDFSLLFIDVDHFKNFNDSYGHQTGDKVLQYLAQLLMEAIGPRAKIYRYGGEEFTVLVEQMMHEHVMTLAQRCRYNVSQNEMKIKSSGQRLGRITISIGVAHYQTGESIETLVERTDRAVYAAKQAGRNRVIEAKS